MSKESGVQKSTIYNVLYRVFSILLPLLTAPYLTRVVGRDGFGVYSYAWSVSYIFCLVGMLGLENYGTRAIAQVRDNAQDLHRVFSEIWRMQLLVASVTLVGWLVYVFGIAGEEKPIALALTMMSVSTLVNLEWCLMGLNQFKVIALKNTAVKLLAAASVFLFVKSKDDLWIYGFIWSLATLIGCVSCWTNLKGRVRLVRVDWKSALRHLQPCALLFVSVIAVSVYRQMDKVMVGALAGMEQNGLYESAERIIYCLSGFISAIGSVMMPKAANLQRQGKTDRIRTMMDTTMQGILCMVSAMAFGVAAVAENFTPLFYGEEFAPAAVLMLLLAFTLICIGFANVVRTQWILPQNRDGIVIRSVVTGAVLNLAANAVLIPKIGAMGAVVGTLIAETAVPVVQYLHLRKELPYGSFILYLLSYAAVGSVMLFSVRLVTPLLPLQGWGLLAAQVAVGALVYGAGCVVLWAATGNPVFRKVLRKLKRK